MTEIAPEFTRPVAVDHLRDVGADYALEANEAERAALAGRFSILAIDALATTIHLKPIGGGMVRLDGRLKAQVHQACVVTLVDVPQTIDTSFVRIFSPATVTDEPGGEVDVDYDGEEPPDPLVDGHIDLGEVAAEELALALDPYPRAPGAVFEAPTDAGEAKPAGPFAALAKLKGK
jgi:uncharacterized metal-binding protein YceD (DUF177 family)